jgi:phosphatidate cytidylyltransferase
MIGLITKVITLLVLIAICYELLDLSTKCGIIASKISALLTIIVIFVFQIFLPNNNLVAFTAATLFLTVLLRKIDQTYLKFALALTLFAISVFSSLNLQIVFDLVDQGKVSDLALFYGSIVMRDTAAAVYGYFFPGKILTQLSPNKTLEGAFFGFLMTLLLQFLFAWKLDLSMIVVFVQGLTVGIFGQIGDLIESAIKRAANERHSGQLFGRRGGILDLFDSAFFTLPIWYLVMSIIIYR